MPRMVEPWYVSKLRWIAMPPASAKAIASLIARRSKYFSRRGSLNRPELALGPTCGHPPRPQGRLVASFGPKWASGRSSGEGVGADRAEGAEVARALRVLRAQAEVAGADAGGRGADLGLDAGVVGRHFACFAAAHLEQDQARLGGARQQAAMRGEPVQAKLDRVIGDLLRVERGIGLVVDEDRLAVELADPVDQAFYPRRADAHVEFDLDRDRFRARQRVREVAVQHLASGLGPRINAQQVSTGDVPCRECRVHGRSELSRPHRLDIAGVELVGRSGPAP